MSARPAGPGKPSLTLVVPGLFDSRVPSDAAPRLPALERLLGRADHLKALPAAGDRDRSLSACLFGLFGLPRPLEGDFPAAAVSRLADGGERDDGLWLRADPVHLEPAGGGLILTEGRALKITTAEAERLAAEILENYADEGWRLEVRHPLRWYLKPPQAATIATVPPLAVHGRDVQPFLPAGPDAKTWHTLLNETQILLHTSGINGEREARGLLPVNSLWFWGAGRLPKIDAAPWAQVWSDDPVAIGLARLANIPSRAAPTDAAAWRAAFGGTGEHLVVLDRAQVAAAHGDAEAWAEALSALERDWIEPLGAAVQSGELAALNLWSDDRHGFAATPRALRRWWRRRRRPTSLR